MNRSALSVAAIAAVALSLPAAHAKEGETSVPAVAEAAQTENPAPQANASAGTQSALPDLEGMPQLHQADPVLGMETWTDDQTLLTWMKDEDSGRIVVGYVFDEAGAIQHPRASETDYSLAILISDLFEQDRPEVAVPQEMASDVQAALERLPEAERKAAINGLIEALRGVDGEKAYNDAVAAWLETLDVDASGPDASNISEAGEAADSAAEADTEPREGVDYAKWTPKAVEGTELIDAFSSAFSISLRSEGTDPLPRLWMIIDPTCVPCLSPWTDMALLANDGKIDLRTVLVPAFNEDSFGTIAGILADEDPLGVIRRIASGEKAPFGRFSDLPEDYRTGIQGNISIVAGFEVPSVPLTAMKTADGAAYYIGRFPAEAIADAVVIDEDKPAAEVNDLPAQTDDAEEGAKPAAPEEAAPGAE